MVPEGDADLELALSLHRQLNGLTRRSRSQPQENYKKALQSLKKRHNREGEDRQTSSGGSGKRSSKKQKTNSSSEGEPGGRVLCGRAGMGALGAWARRFRRTGRLCCTREAARSGEAGEGGFGSF